MIRYATLSEINEPQANEFKDRGWCIYTECDEGGSYYLKGFAWVNRIGYVIFENPVDLDYMEESDLEKIGFCDSDFENEVRNIAQKYKNRNYHYHMKGKVIDDYECIRTYSDIKAKELIRNKIKYMKRLDPSVRAYRFGTTGNSKKFWKKYNSIKKNYNALCVG